MSPRADGAAPDPGATPGPGTAVRPPLDPATFAAALRDPPVPPERSWRPLMVRVGAGDAAGELEAVCRDHGIRIIDALDRQIADLAAVRLPAAAAAEREAWGREALAAAGGAAAFGTWVYLPWAARLVHLLDRDDYFDVITNRNLDKLTRDEQLRLREKHVGVIGLSVGGEAAVTVAQEHLCGHMVLADFDALDLSNLNRLGAGCDDLGLNKAVIVARRIVRIDPYLDLTVHEEGVSPDSLDTFLEGLDLVLEECDDLALKYTIRVAARRRRLNLIYAGDERGFLSVEPYALDPALEPFHGLVTQPQPPRASYASPLDFFRALTVWLGGWDAISARSRASLEQVGRTLCGYPQLAGEARWAAGQLAHVARRLLLDEHLPAFVGQLDLDALVPGPPTTRDG